MLGDGGQGALGRPSPPLVAGEVGRGDWWIVRADADTVFRKDTTTLWDELVRRARSVTALRAAAP